MSTILEHFNELEDPRINRTKKYPLNEIIFLVISAVISGCDGWKSIKDFGDLKTDWLRKFLPYKEGIPVDDTIARVMSRLSTKKFKECFINWIQSISETTNGDIVAIDGKTVRRSHDSSTLKSAIHMVSAWSSENGIVLGQQKTSEKSNEITAIPELLESLELKGCTVTIDAMGCQTEIANQLVKKKADYVLALKGNQGNFHESVVDFFVEAEKTEFKNIEHDFFQEVDSGHGRIEERQCFTINPWLYSKCFDKLSKWKNIKNIVMIKNKRIVKEKGEEKSTKDTRFYISSCNTNAKSLLNSIRQHWGIENSLHWVLDVNFNEDQSRIRRGDAPENLAILRHMALNVIKKDVSKKASVRRKMNMASLSDDFRTTLINNILVK